MEGWLLCRNRLSFAGSVSCARGFCGLVVGDVIWSDQHFRNIYYDVIGETGNVARVASRIS